MAIYQPSYIDKKTGEKKASKTYWYHFTFAGRHIQESTKSTRRTVARDAEKKRRLELEQAYNDTTDRRHERIRTISEMAETFLEDYRLRNPRPVTFAEYALGHVTRHLGKVMAIDMNDTTVKSYQTARLREHASPKSINEEVGFLLRILGDQGDTIRAKLRRTKTLKLSTGRSKAKAFTPEEKAALLAEAKRRRSPSIFPALTLNLHVGMRDKELRGLQWDRVDLQRAIVTVGDSKTEAGEGRTIPLNADAQAALEAHSRWYLKRFGELRPDWYVFPGGQPQPTDPTNYIVQDCMGDDPEEGRSHGSLARRTAHIHHRSGGVGGSLRRDDPRHCWSRLQTDAQALLAYPHGSETAGGRCIVQAKGCDYPDGQTEFRIGQARCTGQRVDCRSWRASSSRWPTIRRLCSSSFRISRIVSARVACDSIAARKARAFNCSSSAISNLFIAYTIVSPRGSGPIEPAKESAKVAG
jgi:integrase